jgi:hypothetical protein
MTRWVMLTLVAIALVTVPAVVVKLTPSQGAVEDDEPTTPTPKHPQTATWSAGS